MCYDVGKDWSASDFASPTWPQLDATTRTEIEQGWPCVLAPECTSASRGVVAVKPGYAATAAGTATQRRSSTSDGELEALAIFACPLDGCPAQDIAAVIPDCNEGYNGIVCGACAEGYSRSDEQCIPCEDTTGSGTFVISLIVVGVAAVLVVACCVSGKRTAFERKRVAEQMVVEYAYYSRLVVPGKILIGLLQVHALAHSLRILEISVNLKMDVEWAAKAWYITLRNCGRWSPSCRWP